MLIFNCKSAKQKKSCFELVENNSPITLKNYEEFIEYVGIDKLENITIWVVDGIISSPENVKNIINNKRYKLLTIDLIKGADGSTLDGPNVDRALIITTNKCLEKYKSWN
ncbi:hypothetical protein C1T31_06610 [Hanstruepera neustonica]|uniref:Uncharacterized protein n=2 Tax=Hanstruepera neustonica TaxID=1445657 RepID=A0A2K1E132_9FLAO|nr:hypothetical protein C1T31_06610 [Hanstruepera neustonica]